MAKDIHDSLEDDKTRGVSAAPPDEPESLGDAPTIGNLDSSISDTFDADGPDDSGMEIVDLSSTFRRVTRSWS